MTDRIEKIFTNFANKQEESLKEMGLTKEEFIGNAKEWSKTEEGSLEIQKFILEQEINGLKNEIKAIEDAINKKQDAIQEIVSDLEKLQVV